MHRHTHLKVRTAVVNDGNAVVSPFGWKGRYHVVSNHVKLIHISQFAQTSDFRNFKPFDPNRRLSFVPTGDSFVRRDPPKGDSHTSQGLFRLWLTLFQARTPQGLLEPRDAARGVCDATRVFRTSSNPGDLVTCQIRKTNGFRLFNTMVVGILRCYDVYGIPNPTREKGIPERRGETSLVSSEIPKTGASNDEHSEHMFGIYR